MKLKTIRKDYQGIDRTLVNAEGKPMLDRSRLTDSKGVKYTLIGGSAPHKPSSTGKVLVLSDNGLTREFYPSVFNLHWS